jgi:uncharacterized ParB-like nuclease family protein
MDSLMQEISEWRQVSPTIMPVRKLVKHEGLQPRNPRVTRLKESNQAEKASALHVDRLADLLRANSSNQLDPLLVAKVGEQYYVVDGHHRLMACQRAGRKEVAVCIKEMQLDRAALLSKLVNSDGVKLPLTRGQAAESAWQYVAWRTHRGKYPLPKGDSLREIAARFGVSSHETIRSMLARITQVDEQLVSRLIPREWCDPVTGWPLWTHVRSQLRDRFGEEGLQSDQREEREIARCAQGIVRLLDQFDHETYSKAFALVAAQQREDEGEDPEVVQNKGGMMDVNVQTGQPQATTRWPFDTSHTEIPSVLTPVSD